MKNINSIPARPSTPVQPFTFLIRLRSRYALASQTPSLHSQCLYIRPTSDVPASFSSLLFYIWVLPGSTCSCLQSPCCHYLTSCILRLTTKIKGHIPQKSNQLSRTVSHEILAVSHGFLSSRSLNCPKSTFLKSGVVILLFACFSPLTIQRSTASRSLQPRLSPPFTSSTSSSFLASTRFHRVLPPIGSSITWVRNLPSTHYGNLLDCLCTTTLFFQNISGWVNFPTKTWLWECEASSRRVKKVSSTSFSSSGL